MPEKKPQPPSIPLQGSRPTESAQGGYSGPAPLNAVPPQVDRYGHSPFPQGESKGYKGPPQQNIKPPSPPPPPPPKKK